MKKQNTLFSFNEFSKKEDIISACKNSKFIISATGDLHFVNHDFVNPDKGQVLIDI
jgi:5,10-methylene-tetrahydrofolate dehydrogenase/methenyl tetrahydrofolate cyclohydrolase